MYDLQSPVFHQRRLELEADYAEAINSILAGKILPLDDVLRYLLVQVEQEVQAALDEGLTIRLDDLALLCAEVTKAMPVSVDTVGDTMHTLFILSKGWLAACPQKVVQR